jgi:hypothetical protein
VLGQKITTRTLKMQFLNGVYISVSDPNWIRIWEEKNDPQEKKKIRNFMFWSAECSLLRAEGFFCSLNPGSESGSESNQYGSETLISIKTTSSHRTFLEVRSEQKLKIALYIFPSCPPPARKLLRYVPFYMGFDLMKLWWILLWAGKQV